MVLINYRNKRYNFLTDELNHHYHLKFGNVTVLVHLLEDITVYHFIKTT
jgi:hypothetical protein